MARETIKKGLTSVLREFTLRDSSTGQPKTGIAYGSVTIKYTRAGDSAETTITAVSGTLGTWTSSGWAEYSGTGKYQFGIPNAAVATGVDCVSITVAASGCITKEITIQLTAVDPQDSVRLGMTALPNAAPGAQDGLVKNGANTGTMTLGTLGISGPVTLSSTLSVTGLVTYGSLTVSGGTTLTGGMAANITGNLTGNVTGSVGSVTGAVGSVTGNVGGNVAGSTASVTGAVGSVTGNVGGNVAGSVGSVTGAVGSVTGNVGGNVTGSVGSVTGAVGSVTGNVGGNVIGSVGGLPSAPTDWLTAAAVKADAVTKIQSGLSVLTASDLNNATPTVTLAASQSLYAPAKAGDAMTLTIAYDAAKTAATATSVAAITTILSGITSLAKWLRAFVRKDTPDSTALSEINDTGGGYDATTDSQQAIRDRGDAAWSGGGGSGLSGPSSVTLTFVDADSNPVPLVAFTLLSADKSSVIGSGRADSNGVATFGTTDDNYYVTTQATSTVLFADEPLTVSGTTAATITGSSNAPAGSADAGACTIYDTTRGTDDSIKDGVIYNVKIVGGPAGTQNGLEFSATSSGTSANNMSFTLGRGVQFVLKRGTWASWSDPILVPDAASAQLASLLSGTIVGKDSAAP